MFGQQSGEDRLGLAISDVLQVATLLRTLPDRQQGLTSGVGENPGERGVVSAQGH
jgi:hypothetical protein